jgi:hypothetical protein
MSFEALKKNRKSIIDKLVSEVEKTSNGNRQSSNDDSVWKPTVDKSGNGYAVIRFLPASGDGLPWAQWWDHGFKGPTGRWYIEKSLTSISQPDPVGELNSFLWNTGRDEDKELARARKRRLHYVSNIYVVSDPGNPDNEGKVFLYKYGKKIFEKLMDVMQPEFQDETPINPFDFWEGADFKLKIRNVDGYRNYGKSEFSDPAALLDGDDKKLKALFDSLHSFEEFTDPAQYKSYEALSRKLHDVLGDEAVPGNIKNEVTADAPEPGESKDSESEPTANAADKEEVSDVTATTTTSDESDDGSDEEMMSFFAKLAKED